MTGAVTRVGASLKAPAEPPLSGACPRRHPSSRPALQTGWSRQALLKGHSGAKGPPRSHRCSLSWLLRWTDRPSSGPSPQTHSLGDPRQGCAPPRCRGFPRALGNRLAALEVSPTAAAGPLPGSEQRWGSRGSRGARGPRTTPSYSLWGTSRLWAPKQESSEQKTLFRRRQGAPKTPGRVRAEAKAVSL